jgi:hypothetical protein
MYFYHLSVHNKPHTLRAFPTIDSVHLWSFEPEGDGRSVDGIAIDAGDASESTDSFPITSRGPD